MLKLILRLLTRPVFAHSGNQKPSEPPCYLSLREMADMPAFHPCGRD
jgi:hypothetical protein